MSPELTLCRTQRFHPMDRPHKASLSKCAFLKDAVFHLRTLWLFTYSDLKTIIFRSVVLSVVNTASGHAVTRNAEPDFFVIASNFPRTIAWLYLNLLLFNIANQRLPGSIAEDYVNKPWRPLPSRRITQRQSKKLLLVLIPLAFSLSLYLGVSQQGLSLLILAWVYNDLGGAYDNIVVRNALNAFGITCYGSGATAIISGDQSKLNATGHQWFLFLGMVIFTTVRAQDMCDQKGDTVRGRCTIPLVMGDGIARWTIAVGVLGWSAAAPAFWRTGIGAYVIPLTLGGFLVLRTLAFRDDDADEKTWIVWCVWILTLYMLPLVAVQD